MNPSSSRPQRNRRLPQRFRPSTPPSSSASSSLAPSPPSPSPPPPLPPPPPLNQSLSRPQPDRRQPDRYQPPSSSLNPSSSRPPQQYRPPLQPVLNPKVGGGSRWVFEPSGEGFGRARKLEKDEEPPILENGNPARIFKYHEVTHITLRAMRNRALKILHRMIDSPSEIHNNPQDHQDPPLNKWESNEDTWKDYPLFVKSLKEDFPFISIHRHISSLKYFKKSMLDRLEREQELEILRNRRWRELREDCRQEGVEEEPEWTEEQKDDFVRSLITSPAPSTVD